VADRTNHIADDEYLSAFYRCAYGHLATVVGTGHQPSRTVEIGSGRGLARLSGHSWWHSDVLPSEALTLRNSAERLPFHDQSLDALILKDTWHHIPDIEAFLDEAHRVLRVGGTIAVFDPYWGILARFVYRFLHQERWDTRALAMVVSFNRPVGLQSGAYVHDVAPGPRGLSSPMG